MAKTEAEQRDEQRDKDRDEELARQKKVTDALEKHYIEERRAAEKRLLTGITVVEGKP